MKKLNLFLSAAFIMAASAMFAQTQFFTENPFFIPNDRHQWANEVAPIQAPAMSDCADCSVDQITTFTYSSAIGENLSMVNQTGEQNNGNAYQTGATNYSKIVQDGADSYLGVGAVSPIGGALNDAQVYQQGDRNYSDVGQHGDNNDSDVIQIGNDNYGEQKNIGAGWAESNVTYLRQEGNGNASVQTQWLDGNIAKVEQLSSNNRAIQTQTSTDTHTAGTGNTASIMQYGGDENKAQQTQTGTHNQAFAEQNGMGNESVSTQTGSGTNFSYVSQYAYTLQVGENNLACVDQKTGVTSYNLSAIYQFGNDNKAGVTQDTNAIGNGNFSYITQLGNANNACVTQFNGLSGL